LAYSSDIYRIVESKLANIRNKKQIEATKKRDDFLRKFPEAQKIETEISKFAIKIAKNIILGKDFSEKIDELKKKNLSLQNKLKNLERKFSPQKDFFEVNFQCKACKDTGYVSGSMCECMRLMLKKEVYEKLNKFSPISLCSFDTFSLSFYSDKSFEENKNSSPKKRMKKIFYFCKNYADKFSVKSENLLFQGATGLGKTHLSLAIAKKVIEVGFNVIYGSAQSLVLNLEKEKFSYFKEETQNFLKYFTECDLLILDDLGVEFPSTFSNFAIYNLIDTRLMFSKPTIISTNLSMLELEKKYSERLVSRILGEYVSVDFFGEDIRQQKRRKKDLEIIANQKKLTINFIGSK
jgi:DNA replication protein DnaC